MKIINRNELLKLESWVIFSYYHEEFKWIYKKLDNIYDDDFYYQNIFDIYIIENLLDDENSLSDADSITNDGLFSSDVKYILYDKEDVDKILNKLNNI